MMFVDIQNRLHAACTTRARHNPTLHKSSKKGWSELKSMFNIYSMAQQMDCIWVIAIETFLEPK